MSGFKELLMFLFCSRVWCLLGGDRDLSKVRNGLVWGDRKRDFFIFLGSYIIIGILEFLKRKMLNK